MIFKPLAKACEITEWLKQNFSKNNLKKFVHWTSLPQTWLAVADIFLMFIFLWNLAEKWLIWILNSKLNPEYSLKKHSQFNWTSLLPCICANKLYYTYFQLLCSLLKVLLTSDYGEMYKLVNCRTFANM